MAPRSRSFLEEEIATQPADWLSVAAQVGRHQDALPAAGERVAVVGCGTSLFMAQAYAALREAAGQGVTDAWPASEHRLERGYDRVVALTRSGTTTEVLEVLSDLPDATPATVVTADGDSPAVELASPIVLDAVDERSVVQTRFATTALALFRSSLGEDLRQASADARTVLDADDDALGATVNAEQITFLGHGWTVGLANEAALKLRESAQLWTESYPAMEYRHGPISISTSGRVTWAFGQVPARLEDAVRATGGYFEHSPVLDPMADLVRVHRLCLVRAAAAGLDPDRPRGLTRSVVLDK